MYTLLWAVLLPIEPFLLWALAHVHSSLGCVVAHVALGNAHVVYDGWADAHVEHSLG